MTGGVGAPATMVKSGAGGSAKQKKLSFQRQQRHGFCGGAPPRYLPEDLAEIARAPPPVELAADGDEEAAAASEASISEEDEGEDEDTDTDKETDTEVDADSGTDKEKDDGGSKGDTEAEEDASASGPLTPVSGSSTSVSRRSLLMTNRFVFGNREGVLFQEVGCSMKPFKVPHENWGEGPKPKTAVAESEKALVACINGRRTCTDPAAESAARALPSMVALERARSAGGGKFRHKSCAIVGNAGSLLAAPYGEFVNAHDAVIRFNMANFLSFQKHVGNETDYWVNGHARSKDLCCTGQIKHLFKARKTDGGLPEIVLWFPSKQAEVAAACKKRFKGVKVTTLPLVQTKRMVAWMNLMRHDGSRLGLGPFGNWLQLTSGGHAVLHFVKHCESISMYGFTAWKSVNEQDQFTGRRKKVHSGQLFHDWKGESVAWRIMHAAGFLKMCT